MRTTQQLSVTLPKEMANTVKALVASGAYASESEVLRDGLRALLARERATEQWLRTQVIPAANALAEDPTRARSLSDVRARLDKEHNAA
ncbi:MAG: type II toxin-antitoxin system ParD family antitoxin [Rhodocyclaceae bacterium]|jgi:antitoxin ParD1/3/4|nr:type II toxin-antitoxin system ParD family antitoxin [Rhodocyclaceae bacterium]